MEISLKKYGINFEGSITKAVKLDLRHIKQAQKETGFGNSQTFYLGDDKFTGGKIVSRGKWGMVIEWTTSDGKLLYEKRGHKGDSNLLPEAILQVVARECLGSASADFSSCISEVKSILRRNHSVSFLMGPFINVLSVHDALQYIFQTGGLKGSAFDLWFVQILTQIVLILGYLEERLGLNHRDLKGDNILISMTPMACTKEIEVMGRRWSMKYEHEIKLVDFGFACNGSVMNGPASVSVGDTFPPIEWCPKEGRDLYFILCYFYGQPAFRKACSVDLLRQIEKWLFADLGAEKVRESLMLYGLDRLEWISFLVNTSKYDCKSCCTSSILTWISERWPDVLKICR